MPTRILYWNIRDFARNKIDNPNGRKRKSGSSLRESDASRDRFEHVLWLIGEVQPDIIVVVENETGYDAPGRLVRGNGAEGARTLLTGIRNMLAEVRWMLVPPLQTGPNEGVSVFYNSRRRYFTGPYVWPGGGGAIATPPGGGVGNYPNIWRDRLPNRDIPDEAQYNGGASERQMAARVSFTHAEHTLDAGLAIDYTSRAPYMTTFCEVDGAMNVVRNLSLFSIHAPASFNARQYLDDLADNEQIVDDIDDDEVRVVLGDFNVNLLRNDLTRATPYDALINQGYDLTLDPLGVPPAPPFGYPGYYATHMIAARRRDTTARGRKASFWSTIGNPEYYPGYGYIGDPIGYAIDNIFTQYGANQAAPGNNNFTIMNPVAGSPYDVVVPPPGGVGVTTGSLDLVQEMDYPPAVVNPANNHVPGIDKSFRGWQQYGHIYSVSDHLSLAIDI